MKAKKLFSLLLALVMVLSLFPAPALAEAPEESPAFTLQPVSGKGSPVVLAMNSARPVRASIAASTAASGCSTTCAPAARREAVV